MSIRHLYCPARQSTIIIIIQPSLIHTNKFSWWIRNKVRLKSENAEVENAAPSSRGGKRGPNENERRCLQNIRRPKNKSNMLQDKPIKSCM